MATETKAVIQALQILRGGPTSGNWGHKGRPGKHGGSVSGGGHKKLGIEAGQKPSRRSLERRAKKARNRRIGEERAAKGKLTLDEAQSHINQLADRFGTTKAPVEFSQRRADVATAHVGHNQKVILSKGIDNPELYEPNTFTLARNQKDIVTHEYGHVIHNDLTLSTEPRFTKHGMSGQASTRAAAGVEWEGSLVQRLEGIAKTHGNKLSEYATKNGEEYMAESFVAYMRGGKWRKKIHPDVLAVFEDLDRQVRPKTKADLIIKGGPGSGNWGHKGRKGKHGGSVAGAGLKAIGVGAGSTRQERVKAAKVTGLTRGVTADTIEDFLLDRRAKLESANPLKQAIKKARPDLDAEGVLMFADVMTMNDKNFDYYADKIGLKGDLDALKKGAIGGQKEIDREIAMLRWELRKKNSLETTGGLVESKLFSDIDSRPMLGKDAGQAADMLRSRHGVKVSIDDGVDMGRAHSDLSRLLYSAEELGPVGQTLNDHVDRVRIHKDQKYNGHTAMADYNLTTKTMNIYTPAFRETHTSTLVHEVGHAAEEYGNASQISKIFDRGTRPSMYAWGNSSENFAETFMHALGGNAGAIKSNMPDQYDFITKTVPNFS